MVIPIYLSKVFNRWQNTYSRSRLFANHWLGLFQPQPLQCFSEANFASDFFWGIFSYACVAKKYQTPGAIVFIFKVTVDLKQNARAYLSVIASCPVHFRTRRQCTGLRCPQTIHAPLGLPVHSPHQPFNQPINQHWLHTRILEDKYWLIDILYQRYIVLYNLYMIFDTTNYCAKINHHWALIYLLWVRQIVNA